MQLFLCTSVAKAWKFRRLQVFCLRWKTSFMISGEYPFRSLYTTVSNLSMYCWWIVFSFNVSSISSNVDWWSFKTNLRDFSWILFIFLSSFLDVHIQIRRAVGKLRLDEGIQQSFPLKEWCEFRYSSKCIKFLISFFADIFQMTFEG